MQESTYKMIKDMMIRHTDLSDKFAKDHLYLESVKNDPAYMNVGVKHIKDGDTIYYLTTSDGLTMGFTQIGLELINAVYYLTLCHKGNINAMVPIKG